jgi:hypothetical protein
MGGMAEQKILKAAWGGDAKRLKWYMQQLRGTPGDHATFIARIRDEVCTLTSFCDTSIQNGCVLPDMWSV